MKWTTANTYYPESPWAHRIESLSPGGGRRRSRNRCRILNLGQDDTFGGGQNDHQGNHRSENEAEDEINPEAELAVTTKEGDEEGQERIDDSNRNHSSIGLEIS